MTAEKEKPLTRKRLRNHIVLTIVSSVLISSLGGAGSVLAFYHKTNINMETLSKSDKAQSEDITEIKDKMGMSATTSAVARTEIKNIQEDVKEVKQTQKSILNNQTEIYKLLVELKNKN